MWKMAGFFWINAAQCTGAATGVTFCTVHLISSSSINEEQDWQCCQEEQTDFSFLISVS